MKIYMPQNPLILSVSYYSIYFLNKPILLEAELNPNKMWDLRLSRR